MRARPDRSRATRTAVTVNPATWARTRSNQLTRAPTEEPSFSAAPPAPYAKDFQDSFHRTACRCIGGWRRRRGGTPWNEHRNLMLVVGATYPREMADLRLAHPDLPFLVPGIGAQGGDLEATLAAGLDARGAGLLINSARNIIPPRGGGIRRNPELLTSRSQDGDQSPAPSTCGRRTR